MKHARHHNPRYERIGAELLRALTFILRDRVKDPRLGDIIVHEVRVSRDLAYATVFFTCFSGDDNVAAQQRLLNGTLAGFLRQVLSQAVPLRVMPALRFVYDDSIQRGEHLAALITQAQPVEQAALDNSHG